MKKIFSFLVLCLLSSMTVGVWAQDLPAKFSSADGTNENWYNVSFKRYAQKEMYWLVDHTVSGALINRVLDTNSANFQWKFVLVPGSTTKFYMVNKQYGEYVSSINTRNESYVDSYGKDVPPALVDAEGNCLIKDWDGSCRWTVNDSYVYYMDANSKNFAAVFEFKWCPQKSGWGIIDTGITGEFTWQGNPIQALNDWGQGGIIVAVWEINDDGSIVNIDAAGVPVITTSTNEISMGALVNNTSETTFSVKGRTLNGNITITKEGPDAAAFDMNPKTFTTTQKGGTVTVTFSPTAVKAHEATLRISTPDAEDKLIPLKGEVYQTSDLPKISVGANEHWYYIQFVRGGGKVLAKNDSDTDPTVMERAFKGGTPDPNQMWKIGGDWNGGYYLVNKAKGQELLYNTKDISDNPGASLKINEDIDSDRYFLPESGYGNLFNFERFKTTNNWQLYNRDVNADGNVTTDGKRYVNEWSGIGDRLHHWYKDDDGNEILFISADQPLIKANPAFAAVTAPVGETKTTKVTVTGLGTTGNINVSITGDDKAKFQFSPTSLPAEGGDIEISFTSDSEVNYYSASLVLSSSGAANVSVPLTGSYGGPIFSTLTKDIWCNIQFARAASQSKVWQNNGLEQNISQTAMVPGDRRQQWKFSGTKDGLFIENREGGKFFYPKNEQGTVPGSYRAQTKEANGDLLAAVYDGGVWMFQLLLDGQGQPGVNDNSQSTIGLWNMDDYTGNALTVIPVETTDVTKPGIAYETPTTNLATQVGETVTAKVTVTAINLTGNITATITGTNSDALQFSVSPSTLPVTGGELTITFAPTTAARTYKGSLILSSSGVKVTVPFTGLGAPKFSTQGNDFWYYIQFERTANRNDDKKSNVWQWNGPENELLQGGMEDDFYEQHWKFVGDWKSEFVIENREGGQIFFNKMEDDLGVVSPTGNALIADVGDPMLLKQNGSKWELQLAKFTNNEHSYLNDPGANGTEVGRWVRGDGGNFVKFISSEGEITGIQRPSFDPTEQLLAMKFYTVQGIEVRQPATTGIYIVKKIYASGKIQVVKQLIVVK